MQAPAAFHQPFRRPLRLLFILCALLLWTACSRQPRIRIIVERPDPMVDLAARDAAARLQQGGFRVQIASGNQVSAESADAIIVGIAAGSGMQPESFEITPIESSGFQLLRIKGADARGAYWGVAEAVDSILATRDLSAVRARRVEPQFGIRSIEVGLAGASTSADAWQPFFDSLLRNRYNAIFFQVNEPLTSYIAGEQSGAVSTRVEWMRALLKLARARGLAPYMTLEKSSLADELQVPPPAPEAAADTDAAAPVSRAPLAHPLAQMISALLRTFPELGGIAISHEITNSMPVERRPAWITENFIAPTRAARRATFIGLDGEWWPNNDTFGERRLVYLCAPAAQLAKTPPQSAYAVLWQTTSDGDQLLPWQDPETVRAALSGMSNTNSAGFMDAWNTAGSPPSVGALWYRAMLWGRMAYSPEHDASYWQQQFADHFGPSGILAYTAASRTNQLLNLLRAAHYTSKEANDDAGEPAAKGSNMPLDERLFRPASELIEPGALIDVLRQHGWLMGESERAEGNTPLFSDALERQARAALDASDAAAKKGLWHAADGEQLYGKLQTIAHIAIAYAEYLRGARELAEVLLTGSEDARKDSVRLFDQATKGIALAEHEAGAALAARVSATTAMAKQMQPWPRRTTEWQVGTLESWHPASPTETPAPAEWKSAQTWRFDEFLRNARQPSVTSMGDRLRNAFVSADGPATPGSWLVAKTSIQVPAESRVAVRIVGNEPPTVWVNRHRAARLTEQQLPWEAAPPPSAPFQAQIYAATVPPGSAEILIAATAQQRWPLISASVLLAPDPKTDLVTVPAQKPAQVDGAMEVVAGTEEFPQAHIALTAEAAATPAQRHAEPMAVYNFNIRTAGFYRARVWCYWRTGSRPDLNISIDGALMKSGFGRGDDAYQKWHWLPISEAVALSSGTHQLTITGWKPGLLIGTIEVYPAW